ncbi:MAG: GAF domain-containing protein [Chloracidobacterium sp.]|nr:GAF domain-containing protein [Chloracidobacterium sp.]
MNAKLTITDPTGHTWETECPSGETITIGRARENVITLNDRRVSRKHAFIIGEAGAFRIVDGNIENGQLVRSVNHVFVNGSQHLEAMLNDDDVIVIGESQLVFSSVNTSAEAEPKPAEQAEDSSAPSVTFDDAPMGHTQVQLSVNEFMGRRSNLSLEAEAVTPEEVKDLRRKAKILELLFEMSKMLGTVFDLEEIFERATDLIFRGTPADRVIALLTNEETGAGRDDLHASLYQIGAKTREASFAKLSEKLGVSRTITRKVMNDRVAVLSQDAKTDEQFGGAESIVSQGVRSTICAPLITQSGVHGVIYADRLDPFAAFRQDHLELISAVAAQTAVTVETVKAHQRLAREEVARANYGRFMPEYVVKQLLENPDSFQLGGVNETITVLFADIRGFTGISERADPEQIVGLLNQYFSAMSEIIFENDGTLDKYIGDGLMALFGAPKPTPNDARNALTAAVAMQKKLAEMRSGPRGQEFAQLSIGIGLHTGVATIGYIGSERRSEYTAIGDTVNLAARLESNAKGGQILISSECASAAGNIFPLDRREPITVKNRTQPVELFEVRWQ